MTKAPPKPLAQPAQIGAYAYAISRSTNHVGINGVAAPLLDPADNAPLGAVAVAAYEQRLPLEGVARVTGRLPACRLGTQSPTEPRHLGCPPRYHQAITGSVL